MRISYVKEFLTLAEKCNYGKASKELYISQTALFNHIKILEEEMDVPLFERTGKAIKISKYGQIFLPYAHELADTYDRFEEEIMEAKLAASQEITVATQYRIMDLTRRFRSAYNNYIVHTLDSDDIEESLYQGGCELAFVRNLSDDANKYNSIPYINDSIVAVLYRSHPLAKRESIRLRELKNEYFVIPSLGKERQHGTISLCKDAGFMPKVIMTVLTGIDAAKSVNEELGISLLLQKTLKSETLDNIVLIDLEPRVECNVSLCWRKDITLSPGAKQFIKFVEQTRQNEQPDTQTAHLKGVP